MMLSCWHLKILEVLHLLLFTKFICLVAFCFFTSKLMCALFYFLLSHQHLCCIFGGWKSKGWRCLAGKRSDELTRLCKLVRLQTICAFGKCYDLLEQCLLLLLSLNKLIVNCFMQRQTRCSWMMEWGGCQLFFPTNGLAEAVVVKTNAKTPWILSSFLLTARTSICNLQCPSILLVMHLMKSCTFPCLHPRAGSVPFLSLLVTHWSCTPRALCMLFCSP